MAPALFPDHGVPSWRLRFSISTSAPTRPGNELDGIFLKEYTEALEIEFDREFEAWLQNLIKAKDDAPENRLELALALLGSSGT
jgi:hypothetical protein